MISTLTTAQLLQAYASGYFPMADSRDAEKFDWYSPKERGILPLDAFHIPRSLQKFLRHCPYEVKFNTAFPEVIRACADSTSNTRKNTWINDQIIALYSELAEQGHAHSVECWQDGKLAGGLYGVTLGAAFFGESMFSVARNASKVALVHLVKRLRDKGYLLLDTQYTNEHLMQFGIKSIARDDYLKLLDKALQISLYF